ncbi:MAG: hypothetical protein AAF311_04880 [Pseudomonadota bacterium]
MTNSQIAQVVVGFTGFVLSVSAFWLGEYFDWDLTTEIYIALCVAIATILIELVISFRALKESITKLYPSLDFSVNEQKAIYSLISEIIELRTNKSDPFNAVALNSFEKGQEAVRCAAAKNDFEIENMFEANLVAFSLLKPGDECLVLSSVINPDWWHYDQHLIPYKKVNYDQARRGVKIRRVFMLDDEAEFTNMKPIMQEQSENGVEVSWVMKDDLRGLSFFPDFTLIPQHRLAIYTPSIDKLMSCVVTQNRSILSQIRSDFDKICARAKRFEAAV